MPPAKLMMKMMGDLLRNVFTGYYEEPKATDPERTEQRRQNIINGCTALMEAMVGRGDLLDSQTRYEFAKEAYAATNACSGCKDVPCLRDPNQFVTFNEKSVSHTYASDSPFRDIAHAIVNNQDKLNEALFDTFVKRIQERYESKTKDDCVAMAVEFAIIAASCAGVHDIYVGMGMELPPLPVPSKSNQEPYFQHVSDYATSPLEFDKEIAWGPYQTNFRPEVVKEHNFDPFLHSFRGHKTGPTSKSSAVPITSYKWLEFMTVMYFEPDRMGFFDVPGHDRCLSRAQIELPSAAYNNGKHCSF